MNHQDKHQNKIQSGWLKALNVLTISLAAIAAIKSPALAESYLAQVGFGSSVNRPTSLNITPPPGTHIPLPESNYHNRDYYYGDYHSYDRYDDPYDDDPYDDDYYSHRRRDRRDRYPEPGATVIIINPPVYNTPRTEEKTYIRVIKTE